MEGDLRRTLSFQQRLCYDLLMKLPLHATAGNDDDLHRLPSCMFHFCLRFHILDVLMTYKIVVVGVTVYQIVHAVPLNLIITFPHVH